MEIATDRIRKGWFIGYVANAAIKTSGVRSRATIIQHEQAEFTQTSIIRPALGIISINNAIDCDTIDNSVHIAYDCTIDERVASRHLIVNIVTT